MFRTAAAPALTTALPLRHITAQFHQTSTVPAMRSVRALFIYLLFNIYLRTGGFSGGSVVKNPPAMQEMQVQSLGLEDLPEKATDSSILA